MSIQPLDERNVPVNSDPSRVGTDGTYASAPTPALAPANGLGTTGMVLGIVGAALCLVPVVGFLLGLLATVFGGIGLAKANRGEATNKGMAVAGLVLGIITMAVWPVLIAIAAAGAAISG
jgi:hypothetical protein